MFEEPTAELRMRRWEKVTPYWYLSHRSEKHTKPYKHAKLLNALMLQPKYPHHWRDVTLWLTSDCQNKEQRYASVNKLNFLQKDVSTSDVRLNYT